MAGETTPRPWHVNHYVRVAGGVQIGAWQGEIPATAYGLDDAELIVRAVNAHDELVSALEGLVECLEDGVFDESHADLMREKGRAALAKAKAEEVDDGR